MTELSTAPTTSPANSTSDDNAAPQDAGQVPAAPANATASTVLDLLEVCGWKPLHHRQTADKNPVAIDHLAVGPGGIFVIDAHSWTPQLTSTLGPDQQLIIDASVAIANRVRTLLPPLTRQYVVPLLTYIDASPMSMVRGSLHICTTSMLQGVITSRRPVLSAGEIDDVLASLSSGLRSSPGAASATPPPSATPTRRGFLRKASRASNPDAPPSATPNPTRVPPVAASAPPIEPVPVTEVAPPSAERVETQQSEPPHDYWPEPTTPTATTAPVPTPEPAAPESPYDYRHETSPELAGEAAPLVEDAGLEALDEEVADLAHPVVPSDSSWDLIEEPPFEVEQESGSMLPPAEPQPEALPDTETKPAVAIETTSPGSGTIGAPGPVEPIQPSLTVSAVSAAPSTPAPTLPRRAGGRRKAPASKTGVSRLIPTLAPRPSARSSRRSAATTADADSSQEGDLDGHGLTQELTSSPDPRQEPVRHIGDPDPAAQPVETAGVALDETYEDQRPEQLWAADEAALVAAYASLQSAPEPVAADISETVLDHAPAEVEPGPIVAQRSIETTPAPAAMPSQPAPLEDHEVAEPAFTTAQDAMTPDPSEQYDFAELDEPMSAGQPSPPVDDREDEPSVKRPKRAKMLKRPRVRRSKDREIDDDDDVDLSQMPSNLSERGRQMYVEMQRRPKVDPTPRPTVPTASNGRAGAVRKLFVFCVIGGAIGISSSHYDEINGWVSTHVEHLPGLNKIEGPPQPELPAKAKQRKANKAKQVVKDGQGKQ